MKKILLCLLVSLLIGITNFNVIKASDTKVEDSIVERRDIYNETTKTAYLSGYFPTSNKPVKVKYTVKFRYNENNAKLVAVIGITNVTIVTGSSYSKFNRWTATKMDDHTINVCIILDSSDDYSDVVYLTGNLKV